MSRELQGRGQPTRERVQRFDRRDQRAFPFWEETIELLATASTPWRRIAYSRGNEPFLFQSRERGVDGAQADTPLRPSLDLLLNGDAEPVLAESHKREKHNLFELTQGGRHYFFDISGHMTAAQAKALRRPKM